MFIIYTHLKNYLHPKRLKRKSKKKKKKNFKIKAKNSTIKNTMFSPINS